MLLEMLLLLALVTPKSVLKLARAMVVPTKAESYPNLVGAVSGGLLRWLIGPKEADAAYRKDPTAMMEDSM